MLGQPSLLDKVTLTPLKRIHVPTGDILHGLKLTSDGYQGFGEAYFSCVHNGAVKGWKKHTVMTLNLIVCQGEIRFIVYDEGALEYRAFQLTPDRSQDYARLTVPPGLWVAFGGVGTEDNMLLNIASIEHDPVESITQPIDSLSWTWG